MDALLAELAAILSEVAGVDPGSVTPGTALAELSLDSLTMVEVIVATEDRFGAIIDDDQWQRYTTVGELLAHVERIGAGGVTRTLDQETRRRRTVTWVVGLATAGLIFDGYDLVVYGTVSPRSCAIPVRSVP